jgi:serine/threonine protein kinase/WD40 repeat protein
MDPNSFVRTGLFANGDRCMSGSACPRRSEIRDLARGHAPIALDDELAEHLDHCPECQAELAALDGAQNSFVFTIQKHLDPDAIRSIPILQHAVAQLDSGQGAGLARDDWPATSGPLIGGSLGEFEIVRELPGGGMGRIFEAIQRPLGRRVALKTIRGERLSSQKRERFLREQTVLAALHQTHIVPIHMAGQTGDLHYFAMPYIEGKTLQQIIATVCRQHSRSLNSRTPSLAKLASRVRQSTLTGAEVDETSQWTPASPAAIAPADKIRLSREYLRSVAQVMLEAAEACHHVHSLNILHRDIKPSNLMVDTAGECWIIDFGLAHFLSDESKTAKTADEARNIHIPEALRRQLTHEYGSRPGTPPYMAPEQFSGGKIDARTDVWGLGVTLYELLALRPAFSGSLSEIERKVQFADPTPPGQTAKDLPLDLEAICLKALKREPAARYQTAGELAADLRRWLGHEPVTARRTHVLRRVMLWARRNRGWAAAITAFALLVVACALVAAAEIRSERNRIESAQRENLIQKMQSVRLLPHTNLVGVNWVEDGMDLVRQAARIRKDDTLRDQAAAFLAGVSGDVSKTLRGFRSSSVAIDADARRVLIGGSDKGDQAKIWDSMTDETPKSGLAGAGPVAFRPDGAAWQLAATKKVYFPLQVWDVTKRKLVRKLELPDWHGKNSAIESHVSAIALTPDGKFAAALATGPDPPATLLAVWNASEGSLVRQIHPPHDPGPPTAIALSSDGKFLAAGLAGGQITIWPLPAGDPFSLPSTKRVQVNCLAFGANAAGRMMREAAAQWFLASGDHGGGVTVWDLGRRVPSAYCRGSYCDVYALAFSPDGVTLASTGRDSTRLWDTATGRQLLELHNSDWMTGIAFSRDAKKIAVSLAADYVSTDPRYPGLLIFDLEYHRGIQTLRGLESQIAHSKVTFSRDANRVAALSLGWQVAIWDLPSGFLRFRFDVTPGFTADNAGLAFSPDGRKFAISVGSEARLWNLEDGAETVWNLPEGLVDTLVFDATGTRLFLGRMETSNWKVPPYSQASVEEYPRVWRVRDLLASGDRDLRVSGKINPAWETGFFNRRVVFARTSPDGRYIVVTGDRGSGSDKTQRFVKIFVTATGKELLSLPGEGQQLDATGRIMQFEPESPPSGTPPTLIEVPSGKWLGGIDPAGCALGPDAHIWATNDENRFGFTLHRQGDPTPLVKLGEDTLSAEGYPTFSSDGSRLVWGNQDGTVTVCYLPEIQRRLSALGFGW